MKKAKKIRLFLYALIVVFIEFFLLENPMAAVSPNATYESDGGGSVEYSATSDNKNLQFSSVKSCSSNDYFIKMASVKITTPSETKTVTGCVYSRSIVNNGELDSSVNVSCQDSAAKYFLLYNSKDTKGNEYYIIACSINTASNGNSGNNSSENNEEEQGSGTLTPAPGDNFKPSTSTPNLQYNNVCANENVRNAVILIGKILWLAIYIIPLIIIVLGMVDFGKAVTSNDEKAISKATGTLIRRVVAGIIVIVLPNLLKALISQLQLNSEEYVKEEEYKSCLNCLLAPSNDCSLHGEGFGGTSGGGGAGRK